MAASAGSGLVVLSESWRTLPVRPYHSCLALLVPLPQHQPKDARENIVHYNVDLQLSGHTHGGFMPGISTIISRASNGFIRGLYPICGKFLYVSPGCGQCAWLPVRFLDNSEITVVVLRQCANR